MTAKQRQEALAMLAQGYERDVISERLGLTIGQISALRAHITMGTYKASAPLGNIQTSEKRISIPKRQSSRRRLDILLGNSLETPDLVYWKPDPKTGAANPHILILGESGFGKTYSIYCLLAELAHRGIHSLVFDYAQGFSAQELPGFAEVTNALHIHASRSGINVNPLQMFPTDVLGPVNVAQRIADTFGRVYSKLGVQQHAILRDAVLDVMADGGVTPEAPASWSKKLPEFRKLKNKLDDYAWETDGRARIARMVASHISTLFVFNTLRPSGYHLKWPDLLKSSNRVTVFDLKGLESSLERAVTEFLLWNLIGYLEASGPSPLRAFIVLDEAHKLSFAVGSPVEKLLREGRKFGVGLILASQQPEDFGFVAFGNTATKVVFQIRDERLQIARLLSSKITGKTPAEIWEAITKSPRGVAYVVSENKGSRVQVTSLQDRRSLWQGNDKVAKQKK